MTIARKLFSLLTSKERIQAQLLLLMVVIMALLDAIGVASIMPFMAVITKPELIETNAFLTSVYEALGTPSKQDFLLILAILMLLLLLLSLSFKALTTYSQIRFTLMREHSIGKRLVDGYLHQPYAWFLARNSSELGKTILSEVNTVIYNGMLPLITLVAQSAVVCALLILLVAVEPVLAITVGAVLSVAYGLIFKLINQSLNRLGQDRLDSNSERYLAVSEAFSAVKEIKIANLESSYISRFSDSAEQHAKHQSAAQVIVLLPRFALEAIAFGGIMLIVLYLMLQGASFSDALPIISLYAFAGYRLVPALQQIYSAVAQLRFTRPAIDALCVELSDIQPSGVTELTHSKPIVFDETITLKNVHFAYPSASRSALVGVSLTVPARQVIGLVGPTGCGKTTAVDLILGLLEPQQGSLCVDGQVINSTNLRQWQKLIGYVPQQIYLTDDTVLSNIAFGVSEGGISRDAVILAAKVANLHDFIVNELPDGYETRVGERGVRLSGGQRQRIGIARALHHKPKILILDEATSALDNLTELAVMEAINKLRHDITIILIAHRLSTVKECDQIYLMEGGTVIAQGRFDQLRASSTVFQSMTKVFE